MKNYKNLLVNGILISFQIFTISSCASQQTSPKSFEDRFYYLCDEAEVKDPVGKACFTWCKKKKFLSDECKEMGVDVKDLRDPVDFAAFKSAGFMLLPKKVIEIK